MHLHFTYTYAITIVKLYSYTGSLVSSRPCTKGNTLPAIITVQAYIFSDLRFYCYMFGQQLCYLLSKI